MLQPHALFRSVSSRLLYRVQLHNVINIRSQSMNSQTLLRNYKKNFTKLYQKTQRKAYKETVTEKEEIQKTKKTCRIGGNTKKKQTKVYRKGSNTKNKEKLPEKGAILKTKKNFKK